ncbi:MAG: hypothetical protein ACI92Z_002948, partial [Paracoccaceae bacterium]
GVNTVKYILHITGPRNSGYIDEPVVRINI